MDYGKKYEGRPVIRLAKKKGWTGLNPRRPLSLPFAAPTSLSCRTNHAASIPSAAAPPRFPLTITTCGKHLFSSPPQLPLHLHLHLHLVVHSLSLVHRRRHHHHHHTARANHPAKDHSPVTHHHHHNHAHSSRAQQTDSPSLSSPLHPPQPSSADTLTVTATNARDTRRSPSLSHQETGRRWSWCCCCCWWWWWCCCWWWWCYYR